MGWRAAIGVWLATVFLAGTSSAQLRADYGVMVRMRDGVKLASDIWRPEAPGYTSDVLTEPLEIIGNVAVNLEASTDARDTDFTAILSDVWPDGKAVQLGARLSIRRGRYRHGFATEGLLTPGKVETFPLELYDMAHQFEPGHRIRLEVSSSAAPEYNPNQNTGNPVATDTEWKVAHQTIFHDRIRAPAVTLPIMPKEIP